MTSLLFIVVLSSVLVSMVNGADKMADLTEMKKKYLRDRSAGEVKRRSLQMAETVHTKDSDKFCVLHVGPHKTGTTTLQQWILGNDPSVLAALEQDNYGPGGMNGQTVHAYKSLANCLNTDFGCSVERQNEALEDFKSHADDYARRGLSMIVSSEEFDWPEIDITELASLLVPEFKIHVVVYYRRFYDWIHSLHDQITKPDHRTGIMANHVPFVQWLMNDNNLEDKLQMHSNAVYNRFKEAPEIYNVSFVNMHEDPDNFNTLERFACDHMDNAPHVCELAKSKSVEHANQSKDLDWVLFRSNLNTYHSIKLSDSDDGDKWEQIEAKFYEITDIPRLCLPPEWRDKLLQTSVEVEKALTPESWYDSEEGLENLKSDFEEKINSKLCSIDIEKILTSSEWQDFLTELEEDIILDEY